MLRSICASLARLPSTSPACAALAASGAGASSASRRRPRSSMLGAAAASCAARAPAPASSRAFSSCRPALAMSEFFPPKLKAGEEEPKAGRAWTAAELRLKAFEDLHRLWFVALKERNMLLSDRLYFAQIGQSAPDGARLLKVKLTMARIKVVLGERRRAELAHAGDVARLARLNPVEQAKAAAAQAVIARLGGAEAAADAKEGKFFISYKRFGRKYTVPAADAPAKPTRQQKRRAFKTRRYFDNLRTRTEGVVAARAAIDAAAAAAGVAVDGPPSWGGSAAPQPRPPAQRPA